MKINTRKIEAAELEAMGLSEKALEVYSDSDFTVKYAEDFYEEKDLFELYMNRDYCGSADDIDELSEMLEAYGE